MKTEAEKLRWHKQYRIEVARTGPRRVPAGQARDHILFLLERGHTYETIGREAGVSRTTIRDVAVGVRPALQPRTHRAIMALAPRPAMGAANNDKVAAVGSYRRLRALMTLGYRRCDLAERIQPGVTLVLERGPEARVRATTHEAIKRHYEQMRWEPGPSRDSAARARRAGYDPPEAWDEDTIDDPTARPFKVLAPITRHSRTSRGEVMGYDGGKQRTTEQVLSGNG